MLWKLNINVNFRNQNTFGNSLNAEVNSKTPLIQIGILIEGDFVFSPGFVLAYK